MHYVLLKIVTIVGIIVSVIALPPALLALFALQGVGAVPSGIIALYSTWAVVNLSTILLIVAGFLKRYRLRIVRYFAALHIVVSLFNGAIVIADVVSGNVLFIVVFMLPAMLYFVGWFLHRQGQRSQIGE